MRGVHGYCAPSMTPLHRPLYRKGSSSSTRRTAWSRAQVVFERFPPFPPPEPTVRASYVSIIHVTDQISFKNPMCVYVHGVDSRVCCIFAKTLHLSVYHEVKYFCNAMFWVLCVLCVDATPMPNAFLQSACLGGSFSKFFFFFLFSFLLFPFSFIFFLFVLHGGVISSPALLLK